MSAVPNSEVFSSSGFKPDERIEDYETVASAPERTLAGGEVLFQAGDTRARLYRVERGALCHYRRWDDGRCEIIEYAFPGRHHRLRPLGGSHQHGTGHG